MRNVRMPLQTLTQAFLISTFNQDLFISSPEKLLLSSGVLCENDARLKNIPELWDSGKWRLKLANLNWISFTWPNSLLNFRCLDLAWSAIISWVFVIRKRMLKKIMGWKKHQRLSMNVTIVSSYWFFFIKPLHCIVCTFCLDRSQSLF